MLHTKNIGGENACSSKLVSDMNILMHEQLINLICQTDYCSDEYIKFSPCNK